jgi:hypothetical protein
MDCIKSDPFYLDLARNLSSISNKNSQKVTFWNLAKLFALKMTSINLEK